MKCRGLRSSPVAAALAVALTHATIPASAATVPIRVDFTKPTGPVASARQFGLNVFQGFSPAVAGTPGSADYKSNVAYMHPGFIRHHSWDMLGESTTPNGWLVNATSAQATWDLAKIKSALMGSYAFGPARVMNIPLWPSAMSDMAGKLQSTDGSAFAAYCAALVHAVNVDAKAGVAYWEVTNEQDGTYAADMGDLAHVILQASAAMKAVDPTIKVGGPAFANVWQGTRLADFMAVVGNQLDFISYHSYATGDGSATNASIWDAADIAWVTQGVRSTVGKYASPMPELFHDEYNISYAPPDAKMTDMVGGVFDALAMISLVGAGVDAAAAWNEADGWYGKLDGSWQLRPSAHVFHAFNQSMTGAVVTTTTGDAKTFVALAVQTPQKQAIALVHRSEVADTAQITITGLDPSWTQGSTATITQSGLAQGVTTSSALATGVALAPESVLVITFGGDSSADGGAPADSGVGGSVDAGEPQVPAEAGVISADGSTADAQPGPAGGASPAGATSGCACATAPGRRSAPWTELAIMSGVALSIVGRKLKRTRARRDGRPGTPAHGPDGS